MNKTLIAAASVLTVATAISSVHAAPGLGQSVNTLRPIVETVAAPENSRQMAEALWKDHNTPSPAAATVAVPENSRQMADAVWKKHMMPVIPPNLSDPAGGHFRVQASVSPHIVKQDVAEFTHVKRPDFLTAQGFIKVPHGPEIAGREQMAWHDAKAPAASAARTGSSLVLVSSGSADANGVSAVWRVYEGKAKDGSFVQLAEYWSVPDRDVLAKDVAGYSSRAYFQELSKIDDGDKTPVSLRFTSVQPAPAALVASAHATAARECAALDARLDRQHLDRKTERAKLAKAGCELEGSGV